MAIDTVTTPLTSAWTDLTSAWAAASPPATDGETITVQPADAGEAHAIVIAQGFPAHAGMDLRQWPLDEWLPIAEAMDRLFEAAGWLERRS